MENWIFPLVLIHSYGKGALSEFNQILYEVLMDMERQESTICHLEKLHKTKERPLYGGITAGGVICRGVYITALPLQTGDMQIASEALNFSPEPGCRSLIYFRNTKWRRKAGGLSHFLQDSNTQFNNKEHGWDSPASDSHTSAVF